MVDNTDNGETPNVDTQTQSLADFEKVWNGEVEEAPATVEEEPTETEEEQEEVTEEENVTGEVEDPATEEEEEAEEEEVEEPQPKKHSAQKRINDLTAKLRQSEREANARIEALMREVETLKTGRSEKEEPEALRNQLPPEAPQPDAKDKDGNPIYELGEFDPNYIRDLTKFTYAEEAKAAEQARAQREWEEGVAAAQQELATTWAEKVTEAEEAIPTIREDITTLTDTFEALDPAYGEYLAMTIMGSENGTEIMHYFSQNIGEAQKIVAAGPAAATLAIGRLDARLSRASPEPEKKRNKVVSQAPTPPEKGARGVSGRQTVRDDTDNLDAFSEKFYEPLKKPHGLK